jgi:aldehyde dehydrogenase (NAD+)
VSAGRVLVAEKIVDEFAKRYAASVRRLRVGDPLDAQSFTGPVINEGACEKVLSYNSLAKQEGAQVLVDGGRLTERGLQDGYYLSPFVYRMEYGAKIRSIREEVFGPHVALIPFKTNEDAVRIYNDTDYGLSMAVITESFRNMRLFREECEFGMGYVNLPCIGAEVHLPFGGVKKSGNGHPSAAGLVDVVTHKIAWTVNHGSEIKMAQGLSAEVT